MEIDPVYARLQAPSGYYGTTAGSGDSAESSESSSDQQLASDISDDDHLQLQPQLLHHQHLCPAGAVAAPAEASRQSSSASYSARFAEERPLIRNNTLRRSAPLGTGGGGAGRHKVTTSAVCGGGSVRAAQSPLRRHCDIVDPRHLETPITIALGGCGGGGRPVGGGGGGGEPWFISDNLDHRRSLSSRRPTGPNNGQLFYTSKQGYRP
jgi:hypothetical protein